MDCSTSGCGGNSPIVNRFPINGLHARGCKNAQGIELVGKLQNANSTCNNKFLDVDQDGNLFAENSDCSGEALDGAWFEVKTTFKDSDGSTKSVSSIITIEFYGSVATYDGDTVPGYIFREKGASSRSLCDPAIAHSFQERFHVLNKNKSPRFEEDIQLTQSAIASSPTLRLASDGTSIRDSDIAIAIAGEIRSEDADVIDKSKGRGWFNIACKRDALAKVDLDRIAPAKKFPSNSDLDYYDRRTAALKMVTANYCNSTRYTYEGNEIEWESKGALGWQLKDPRPTGQPEAVWSKNGAVCLEHSRLHYKSKISTIPKSIIPSHCRKHCKNESEFMNELRTVCSSSNPLPHVSDCDKKQDVYFRSYSH